MSDLEVIPHQAENVVFDGDTGRRRPQVRALLTTLLSERVFHGEKKPHLWQVLIEEEADVRSFLHDLYLDLVINVDRKVAFKQQVYPSTEDRKFSPRILLPARTVSVEFAAGVLLLVEESRRAQFSGAATARVNRSAFNEAFDVLWGTEVTNRVARTRNGNASIRALCEEGLLLGPKDGDDWEISPAVQVLYGPAELAHLAAAMTSTDLETGLDDPQLLGDGSQDDADTEADPGDAELGDVVNRAEGAAVLDGES